MSNSRSALGSSQRRKDQSDLTKLPIITRSDIAANPRLLFQTRLFLECLALQGVQREPLKYYIGKECSKYGQLIKHRAWAIGGYQPGDKVCVFAGGSITTKKQKVWLIQKLTNTESFPHTEYPNGLFQLYNYLLEAKPGFFYGYASAWVILSEFLIRNNLVLNYKPKSLYSTAEVLLPQQATLIQRALGVDVYDVYGLNDSGHLRMSVNYTRVCISTTSDQYCK